MVSTEEPCVQSVLGFFINLIKVSSKSVPILLADLADAAIAKFGDFVVSTFSTNFVTMA